MKDPTAPLPIRGAIPCDRCLDQFISTRHQLHQQIKRWQGDYMQMKAENERLRARNAELVEQEIRLRLDRQDAAPPPQQVTDPLGRPRTLTLGHKLRQAVEQQRQQAISKQEGAAS
jgi:hypothetical protein